jgi:apolipoprotein D and lipocalin family protein
MDALAHEIARVERRLIAREIGMQQRANAIRSSARSLLRPRRSMVPWGGVLLMLWPLLPRFLRPRLSPASAITAYGLGAPVVKRLLTNHPAGPATVPHLDVPRYMGLWQEVASLSYRPTAPADGPSFVHFASAPRREGAPSISVLRQSHGPDGRIRESRGVARVVPHTGGARLKLSVLPAWMRWWPGAWDDHWVLHVNADYTEALVGDPGRRRLQVLSRQSSMEPERLQALLSLAQAQGYALSQMQGYPATVR